MKPSSSTINVAVLIVGFALLVANYVYTFGGFVTYTAEERRTFDILDAVYRAPLGSDERKKVLEVLPTSDKESVLRYLNQYKESHGRHKTIQQFIWKKRLLFCSSLLDCGFRWLTGGEVSDHGVQIEQVYFVSA